MTVSEADARVGSHRARRFSAGALIAFAAVLALGAVTAAYRYHHDAARWEPDAAIYLRMALEDRGETPAQAKAEGDRFMLTTSEATNPDTRGFYGPATPAYYTSQFALFRTRPLFPQLGALLYPRFGPRGLQLISAAAYALVAPLMFLVLLRVAPPWLAALGALACATAPNVLDMSDYAMTDELALLLWIAALGAILEYQRRPGAGWYAAALAAALLLTFTRPAAYLPAGAALGVYLAAREPRARTAAIRLLAGTLAVAAVFVLYTIAVHGPGISEQLLWQYHWQQTTGAIPASRPFALWFAESVLRASALAVTEGVYKNGALFTLVLAAFGVAVARPRAIVPVLLCAIGALVFAIAGGPLDIARTVGSRCSRPS